jgi:CDK inhibitor PHO81
MTYAIYHGNLAMAKLLSEKLNELQPNHAFPVAPRNIFHSTVQLRGMDLDEIPSLSLPPPMIPFRIYGHSYLNGKTQLTVHLMATDCIHLSEPRNFSSLKLIVTSIPDHSVPYSRIIPFTEEPEPLTFTLDDFSNFSLQFEIFPAFGSHFLAKCIILFQQLENALKLNINGSHSLERFVSPLLDAQLRCVGYLAFGVSIVTSFTHPKLSIGGNTETYWKATQPLLNSREPSSFITASSLSQEYIELAVQITIDQQLVIYHDYCILLDGISYCISSFTLEQCRYIFSKKHKDPLRHHQQIKIASEYVTVVYGSFMTLNEAVQVL